MPRFPVVAPVNTALELERKADNTVIDFRTLNCAACTAGALTGRTSGAVVAAVMALFEKPRVPLVGFEPDELFVALGREAREGKGKKEPKFPAPVLRPEYNADQRAAQLQAVKQENGLYVQIKALKHWIQGQRGGVCDVKGSARGFVSFASAQDWMARKPGGTEFAVYFKSLAAQTLGHWVYAENRGHAVEFVDYQQYLTAANRPGATKYPSCAGYAAPDASMLMLAFSP